MSQLTVSRILIVSILWFPGALWSYDDSGSNIPWTPSYRIARGLVLFIHGFNGDKIKTWKNFPELVNNHLKKGHYARYDVSSFGYPTALTGENIPIENLATALISHIYLLNDEYRRSKKNYRKVGYDHVLLVCHSMGGVVARQAVISNLKRDKRVKINGMILFAVPNRGTKLADWYDNFTSNIQVRQLRRNSKFLQSLHEDWYGEDSILPKDFFIRTVFAGKDNVVTSASTGLPGVDEFTNIEADHQSLVKPENESHKSFRFMRPFLEDFDNEMNKKNRPIIDREYDKEIMEFRKWLRTTNEQRK